MNEEATRLGGTSYITYSLIHRCHYYMSLSDFCFHLNTAYCVIISQDFQIFGVNSINYSYYQTQKFHT